VRRITGSNRLIYEARAHRLLLQELWRHQVVLVNGLENQAYRLARLLGRRYMLKIVGDTVWETARNQGMTSLSIDDFQAIPPATHREHILATRRNASAHFARLVITPSHYLRRLVIGWGKPPAQVVVVPNGVPLEHYAHCAPVRRTTRHLQVAFCGRLTNWKGVETLLLALRDLPDVSLRIIGDGPELPMLIGLAQQLHLTGQVQFTGRLARQALHEALAQVHVLVLLSLYEGLSHTLLEASAMGLACIASDRGGNPEIITHEETGLLVPYGDVAALQAALTRLQEDEELRYTLACNARDNSARFDFRATVNQTMRLLLEQPADQ
jgi:glycosyltransferase involved in cell wall biosynthesis